jgi:polyphosphate kinase
MAEQLHGDSMHRIVHKIDLRDSALYLNRELSWIEFNRRVLEEAEDMRHPLLERLKFLAIFSANLDEFFMIRIAGLKEQMELGSTHLSPDGMNVQEQLQEIRRRLLPLIKRQSDILNKDILPELAEHGVTIHQYNKLHSRDKSYLEKYFQEKIFPVLTPLAIDPGHPFPRLVNRNHNIIFVVRDRHNKEAEPRIAVLQLPQVISRFIPLSRKIGYHYVLLGEAIKANAHLLFPDLLVEEAHTFRVSRDADIEIAEDEASDLLTEMEEQVRQRHWGDAVRLEVDERMPENLVTMLMNLFNLEKDDVYASSSPLNIADFMDLSKINVRQLKYPSFTTRPLQKFYTEGISIFHAIRQVKFINTAACDPAVLAIKMTLYRTGGDSAIVEALKQAVQNGKQVTAFIELKARFDEENNITWAKELERAGVHVVYGVMGLKIHCKLTLVVRKEDEKMRTYLHLSTGNYNQATARIYTDIGYFTAREDFGSDAIHLFNYLTGYSQYKDWQQFAVAPINLDHKILELIRRETELHTAQNPGEIIVKINSLVDGKVIRALYRASQKGVKIKLIIRGICCLRPSLPGISENIEVRSILGRFLEHTRIIYFKNGGNEEIYLSSADWMPRNLYNRVEIMFPVLEPTVKAQLKRILDIYWRDNTKAHVLQPDGNYTRIQPEGDEPPFNAQQYFLDELHFSQGGAMGRTVRSLNHTFRQTGD